MQRLLFAAAAGLSQFGGMNGFTRFRLSRYAFWIGLVLLLALAACAVTWVWFERRKASLQREVPAGSDFKYTKY